MTVGLDNQIGRIASLLTPSRVANRNAWAVDAS